MCREMPCEVKCGVFRGTHSFHELSNGTPPSYDDHNALQMFPHVTALKALNFERLLVLKLLGFTIF